MFSPDTEFDHSSYEELCGLAAAGELSPVERRTLDEHLAGCPSCRKMHADFLEIASHGLALAAGAKDAARENAEIDPEDRTADLDMYERFLERAGNAVPRQAPQNERTWKAGWRKPIAALGLAAAVAAIAFVAGRYAWRDAQPAPVAVIVPPHLPAAADPFTADRDRLRTLAATEAGRAQSMERRLEEAQARYAEVEKQLLELKSALEAAGVRSSALAAELDSAGRQSAQWREKQQETEARLHTVLNEIQQIRAARVESAQRAGEQAELIASLRRQLDAAEADAERAAAKHSADSQASELFGARDLHIVDVYDVDSKGNAKPTFGRVYYVEKKLLVFYAFDLQEKRRNHKAAFFQAWGYRGAAPDRPHSLGLFQADTRMANRWVLKVSDTRILERIDTIFVTLEPRQDRSVPSGHRLLYANLAGPPNHP